MEVNVGTNGNGTSHSVHDEISGPGSGLESSNIVTRIFY